jgi:hypothetical protein
MDTDLLFERVDEHRIRVTWGTVGGVPMGSEIIPSKMLEELLLEGGWLVVSLRLRGAE